jgi:hypothetical protein
LGLHLEPFRVRARGGPFSYSFSFNFLQTSTSMAPYGFWNGLQHSNLESLSVITMDIPLMTIWWGKMIDLQQHHNKCTTPPHMRWGPVCGAHPHVRGCCALVVVVLCRNQIPLMRTWSSVRWNWICWAHWNLFSCTNLNEKCSCI